MSGLLVLPPWDTRMFRAGGCSVIRFTGTTPEDFMEFCNFGGLGSNLDTWGFAMPRDWILKPTRGLTISTASNSARYDDAVICTAPISFTPTERHYEPVIYDITQKSTLKRSSYLAINRAYILDDNVCSPRYFLGSSGVGENSSFEFGVAFCRLYRIIVSVQDTFPWYSVAVAYESAFCGIGFDSAAERSIYDTHKL
ncbi:hypothetical protein FACS1894188_02230 [Clostridia bacterium]|nr:hypothetical protein FACS1894188_02230 [Clostridia bacterium]